MIERVEGIVTEKTANSLLIMTNGGLGLRIYVTSALLDQCEKEQLVDIRTNFIIHENSMALYGFASDDEALFFNYLIGVSGVGPKLALNILSNAGTNNVRRAVVQEQPDYLGKIPGVGKKTAQKIVLHLQGKISESDIGNLTSLQSSDIEVVEALTALGYSIVQAQTAVQALPKDIDDNVETKLRIALQSLG